MDVKTLIRRFSNVVLIALAPSATILFFIPMVLYLSNTAEFSFTFFQLWPRLLGLTLLSTFVISLVLFWLPDKFHIQSRATALTAIITLLLWIQGTFLLSGMNVLDGTHEIDHFSVSTLINAVLWITAIAAALLLWRRFMRWALLISAIILLTQLVAFTTELYKAWPKLESIVNAKWFQKYDTVWSDDMLNFSKDKNVFLFILDSFSEEMFEQALEDKNIRSLFPEYRYFSNYTSLCPTTMLSVTSILTGEIYNNSIPFIDFIKENQGSDKNLVVSLSKKGYISRLYQYFTPIQYYYDGEIFSNIALKKNFSTNSILSLSLFRCLPLSLKKNPRTVNNATSAAPWDLSFLSYVQESAFGNTSQEPVLFIAHLSGAHPPYIIDSNFHQRDEVEPLEQAKASLKLISIFANKLKEAGVFDNSVIVLTADHGSHESKTINTLSNVLFILKPRYAHGTTITASDLPLSMRHIKDIVLQAEGDALDISKFVERTRYFYVIDQIKAWNRDYMPPINEYVTRDHASNLKSWQKTGNVFSRSKIITDATPVVFPQDFDEYRASLSPGWKKISTGITFGSADQPHRINLNFKQPNTFVSINIKFSKPDNLGQNTYSIEDTQFMHVYNGSFSGNKSETVSIVRRGNPKQFYDLSLDFHSPVIVHKIWLDGVKVLADLPSFKDFRQTEKTYDIFAMLSRSGWNVPEKFGTWSSATNTKISIPVREELRNTDVLFITLKLLPFLGRGSSKQVQITYKDVPVGMYAFTSPAPQAKGFYIRDYQHEKNIELSIHAPTTPGAELNADDPRQLGVAILGVGLDSAPLLDLNAWIATTMVETFTIRACVSGWNTPETEGIWTSEPTARLDLPLAEAPDSNLRVTLNINLLNLPGVNNHLTVSAQGRTLYAQNFAEGTSGIQAVFVYPTALLGDDHTLHLDLKSDTHVLADLLPKTGDKRHLGIFLTAVRVEPAAPNAKISGRQSAGHVERQLPQKTSFLK